MLLTCSTCEKTNEKKKLKFYKIGLRLVCENCYPNEGRLAKELSIEIIQFDDPVWAQISRKGD